MAVLLRALKLLRTNPKGVLDLETLLSEKHLVARVEAVSYGLAIGGLAGGPSSPLRVELWLFASSFD